MIDESKFKSKKELFHFLVRNKEQLIAQKKSKNKHADACLFEYGIKDGMISSKALSASKSEPWETDIDSLLEKDKINVKAVINTTNVMDSHGDVHIDGLWKKSISENRKAYHLQEHRFDFEHIISVAVKASTEKMKWKDLGIDSDGETEALVFDSEIEKSRNPFMFEQYAKGYVDNHSVGMRYVKLSMCVNSEEEEFKP